MKPGDVVDIYQDPITKNDYEGSAKLTKLAIPGDGSPSLSLWSVQFIDGDDSDCTFQRWILDPA